MIQTTSLDVELKYLFQVLTNIFLITTKFSPHFTFKCYHDDTYPGELIGQPISTTGAHLNIPLGYRKGQKKDSVLEEP